MSRKLSTTYTSDLQKTAAVISEMTELIRIWEPGMTADALAERALSSGVLGRVSTVRVRDIVQRSFKQRFLEPDDAHARHAKTALEAGLRPALIRELFLLIFVRTYRVAQDFLVERYWPACAAGHETISNKEIVAFLKDSFGSERNPQGWSESVTTRVARNLGKSLTDFGLFESERTSIRRIRLWEPSDFLITYVLLDAALRETGDTSLLYLPEWRALGMNREDIISRCRRLGGVHGPFLFQYSGELAQFSWRHRTLEDLIYEQAHAE
jgi:hypothetical protein